MYNQKAWGGSIEPFILTKFVNNTQKGTDDPSVSLVIYEWRDEDLIGIYPSQEATKVSNNVVIAQKSLLMLDGWLERMEMH